jgi:quinol monooxygenase YgiN
MDVAEAVSDGDLAFDTRSAGHHGVAAAGRARGRHPRAPSREIEGCIDFDVARCLDDPNSFVAIEVLEDRAALARQEGQSQVGNVLSMLPEVVAAEPVATIYDVSSAQPHGG